MYNFNVVEALLILAVIVAVVSGACVGLIVYFL